MHRPTFALPKPNRLLPMPPKSWLCGFLAVAWLSFSTVLPTGLTPQSYAQPPLKGSVVDSGEGLDVPIVNEDDLKELEPGTRLDMALTTTINTSTIQMGDEFFAKITRDYSVDGAVVIPKGTLIHGVCNERVEPGRLGRNGSMTTRFDYLITPDGREIPIEGKYSNKDSNLKRSAKLAAKGLGYSAVGGVIGAMMVMKYGGLAAVAASNGYALAGGAAIGGAIGLGTALAKKGKHQIITPGAELAIKLQEPIVLPSMTMPDPTAENFMPSGMKVTVLALHVGNDPFGEPTELTLTVDIVNKTPNTFTTFDIALEDEHGSTFYPSPFGDTGLWFQQLKPNSRMVGYLSFSVDNPRLQHHLTFYKRYTREAVARIALTDAMLADAKTAKRKLKEAAARVQ